MVNKIYNKRKFRKRRNKRNTIKKYKGGANANNASENNTQQETQQSQEVQKESIKQKLKNKIKGTKTYQGLAKRAESIKKTGQAINALKKNSMVEFFAEILQYGIFSVVALSVYTPVYLLNIPNTSLENILPKGACKFLFNDEKICKSQIKCLLGFCNDNDELTLSTNVKSKKKEESENEQLEKQQQEPIGAPGQAGPSPDPTADKKDDKKDNKKDDKKNADNNAASKDDASKDAAQKNQKQKCCWSPVRLTQKTAPATGETAGSQTTRNNTSKSEPAGNQSNAQETTPAKSEPAQAKSTGETNTINNRTCSSKINR